MQQITYTIQELNQLLAVLSDMPYKYSASVIDAIKEHATAQLGEAMPESVPPNDQDEGDV